MIILFDLVVGIFIILFNVKMLRTSVAHNSSEETLNSDYLKTTNYIEIGPDKIILPANFQKYQERIQNFQVRDDDVFTLGFLKTGSRWAQEMVWLIVNNLNFKKASEVPLYLRSPLLEYETLINDLEVDVNYSYQVSELQSPRCLRSHLQWTLLPNDITGGNKQPKIVVIFRGPEDTCVSYYHHAKVVDGYTKSFEDYCDLFLRGKVPFGPYWTYVLGMWEQRHKPNIMFIDYTTMKNNLSGTIRDVASFLDKKLSEDDVTKMCEHLSFDNLKQSDGFNNKHLIRSGEKVNPFVRTGKAGGYKNVMSPELILAFQKYKDLYFSKTGLIFN